jgi:hypothetical protein
MALTPPGPMSMASRTNRWVNKTNAAFMIGFKHERCFQQRQGALQTADHEFAMHRSYPTEQ